MTAPALAPCPQCGRFASCWRAGVQFWRAGCQMCDNARAGNGADEAAAAWNRHAGKPEPPQAPSDASAGRVTALRTDAPPSTPSEGAARTYADGLRRGADICQMLMPPGDGSAAVAAALENAASDIAAEALAFDAAQPPAHPLIAPAPSREERLARAVCRAMDVPVECANLWHGWSREMARMFAAMHDEQRAIEDERLGRENGR